ncbi:MAG: putative lipid II flippase FtsW [Thermodesulfobacteriota bacterium]
MTSRAHGITEAIPRKPPYDVNLLFPVLFLVGIGIVMIYSASSALAMKKFGNDYFFLKKQGVFAIGGMIVLVICRHIPYLLYQRLAYPILLAALVLLLAVHFSPLGYSAGGSMRWLRFGSVSFQPSEFARIALIIYLAYSLSRKTDRVREFKIGFLPHVTIFGILAILILMEPDFGSVVILGAVTWIMLYVGGVRLMHLTLTSIPLLPLAYFFMMDAGYRVKRIMSFLNPWEYSTNEGYQIIHSLLAFGTGGIWGVGIGKGYQKLFYLPEPHTDFIFSIIGEELGLVGVMTILGLYGMIIGRGIGISRKTPELFGSYLTAGLTVAIALQVFINMGVTLGLLPTKGLVLPFLSYGGSSLILNMASIGILMNVESASGPAVIPKPGPRRGHE